MVVHCDPREVLRPAELRNARFGAVRLADVLPDAQLIAAFFAEARRFV
jgi:hypothetical protein